MLWNKTAHVEDEKYSQEVVVGVGGHEDELLQVVDDTRLDQLEEDVVAALVGLLVGHPESTDHYMSGAIKNQSKPKKKTALISKLTLTKPNIKKSFYYKCTWTSPRGRHQ